MSGPLPVHLDVVGVPQVVPDGEQGGGEARFGLGRGGGERLLAEHGPHPPAAGEADARLGVGHPQVETTAMSGDLAASRWSREG